MEQRRCTFDGLDVKSTMIYR